MVTAATRGNSCCPICRATVARDFDPKVTVLLRKAILRLFAEDPDYSSRLQSVAAPLQSVAAPSATTVRCPGGHLLAPVSGFFPALCSAVGGCDGRSSEHQCRECNYGLCALCHAHIQGLKSQLAASTSPKISLEQRLGALYPEALREQARQQRLCMRLVLEGAGAGAGVGRGTACASPDRLGGGGWIDVPSKSEDYEESKSGGDGVVAPLLSGGSGRPTSFVASGGISQMLSRLVPTLRIPVEPSPEFTDTLETVDALLRDTARMLAVQAFSHASLGEGPSLQQVWVRADHVELALRLYDLPACGVGWGEVQALLLPSVRDSFKMVTGGQGREVSGGVLRVLAAVMRETLDSISRTTTLCALQQQQQQGAGAGAGQTEGISDAEREREREVGRSVVVPVPRVSGAEVTLWSGLDEDSAQLEAPNDVLRCSHVYRAIRLTALSKEAAEKIIATCKEDVARYTSSHGDGAGDGPVPEDALLFPPPLVAYLMQRCDGGPGPLRISTLTAVAMASFLQQTCLGLIPTRPECDGTVLATYNDVREMALTAPCTERIAPCSVAQSLLYTEYAQHLRALAAHCENRILVCPFTGMHLFIDSDRIRPLPSLDAACELPAQERSTLARRRLTRVGKILLEKLSHATDGLSAALVRKLHWQSCDAEEDDTCLPDLDPTLFCSYVHTATQSIGHISTEEIPGGVVWSREALVALQAASEWHVKRELSNALAAAAPVSSWDGVRLILSSLPNRLAHLRLAINTTSASPPAAPAPAPAPAFSIAAILGGWRVAPAPAASASPVLCRMGHPMTECSRIGTDWSCNMLLDGSRCLSGTSQYLTASNTTRYRCSQGCDYDYCQRCFSHHQSGQPWPVDASAPITTAATQLQGLGAQAWPVRGRGRGRGGRGRGAGGSPWSDELEARRLSEAVNLSSRGRGRGRRAGGAPFAAGRTIHQSVRADPQEFGGANIFSRMQATQDVSAASVVENLSDDDEL
jgi:hypothetical protein